jgi:septum formation protein
MVEIILASQSPRRKQILKQLGLKFKIIPSNVKEKFGRFFSRARLKNIALSKAEFVAGRLKSGLVIGADTVVVLNRKIYGKPRDIRDAKKILSELSGTTQCVWTAIAVLDAHSGRNIVKAVSSTVKMKKLTPIQINMLARKNLDKAGAYAVQEDDRFIESVEGSFTNVVGFPVELFKEMLKHFNIKLPRKHKKKIFLQGT